MTTDSALFPRQEQLRDGAVLATIAYAIWLAHDPTLVNELSWDGPNYSRQDTAGTRGTVTFGDGVLVGVFRDEHSPRSPLGTDQPYNLNLYLRGMPPELRDMADEEALQYVLEDHQGVTGPIITAAFWSDDATLTAAEPWPDVMKHGAHLVRRELLNSDTALEAWREDLDLTGDEMNLARSLFRRKMEEHKEKITLTEHERRILLAQGDEGADVARSLLNAVGLAF